METLATKKCIPCSGGAAPLTIDQQQSLLQQLVGWRVINGHHLQKEYKFPDFKTALSFVNQISEIAESENHHPNISFTWGKVAVEIWTHKINGLTESDFILAAKFNSDFNSDSE